MSSFQLITHLQNPALYDHPIKYFKIIETHISWVILTGDYSYKIKKPLNFEFLDFSSLEQRKLFCEKELELNKKLAPEIYLDVLPITGTETLPQINGSGTIIEYVIKMREFSQENLFDALLQKNNLHSTEIIDLAHVLADFHLITEETSSDYFGTPDQIFEPVKQNFDQIRAIIEDKTDLKNLETLEHWSYTEHNKLHSVFNARKKNGFIRACHGDVHLGNITLFNGKPVIFDCIEFNESFRWTDTMADLGFLLMDLFDKNQQRFANILLNTYMQHTADYEGLKVLKYYQVYRAIVRAKISLFEYIQQTDPKLAAIKISNYRKFIDLALNFISTKTTKLFLTHGFSGSGKSTLAKLLVEEFGLIQLRSDVERKRMEGIAINASTQSALYAGLYSEEKTKATYARLLQLAEICLLSGYSTIIDATFQTQSQRKMFIDFAKKNNFPYFILYCHAPLKNLIESVEKRANSSNASEANKDVLLAQQNKFEHLTKEEVMHSISINTNNVLDAKIILNSIKELL